MIVTKGATDVIRYVYFVDDDGGTAPGEPTTGLLFSDIETGGSASYNRQGAARVDVTLITQTVAGAHADGGFVEVDATNMKGLYRFDPPDAAFVTGADLVNFHMVAAAAKNTLMRPLQVLLTSMDLQDTQRAGLVALPAAGVIPTTAMRGTDGANTTTPPTAVAIAAAVWDRLTSAISAAGSIGLLLKRMLTISDKAIETGTASGTPTTTAMISDVAFGTNDQLKGRLITFDDDTTTATLQNQQTDITGGIAASNTIQFAALTTAPVSGDTFVIT